MLSLDPKAFEADWGIAEVMRRRHKLAEARDILIPMIKEHPDYSPAYITLAYIKYLELDFNAAVRLATKVFEKGKSGSDLSNYVRSYLMYAGAKGAIADKGGVLSKIINGTAVLPNLKKAESLQPESAEVKYGLGSFYLLAPSFVGGDLKSAETYLTEAVKLDPLFPNAYVRLGEVYKMKGDKDRYRQYLNKALELDPENEIAISVREGNCKYVCAEPEVKPEGN
jgi:tetratricopeptide (TPR) repeat protein